MPDLLQTRDYAAAACRAAQAGLTADQVRTLVTAGAHSNLRQAHEIFQRIGATEATGIAIEIAAIAPQQPP